MRPELETLLLKVQKPGRYTGGELNSILKNKEEVDLRFAFCFPDTYEVGMSHLGMKILYSLINSREDAWCERVFAPDKDMESLMREKGLPLFGLESQDPLTQFDILGFTLQYELSYTNILNMLDLAGIPVRSEQRTQLSPLVIAGGPCACNPEPLADFVDLFMLGEAEESVHELLDLYKDSKARGEDKAAFLRKAAQIEGVYVPSLYRVTYREDGCIGEIAPLDGAPGKVSKRIIQDLDKVFYPENFVVPFIDTVHDRAMVEVLRGCVRGCRFCQAGFIYRPFREKEHTTIDRDARALCDSTGYDEISLTSLSTSDHSQLEPMLDGLLSWTAQERVNLALPSLRVDNFSQELMEKIARVRKSGLTFAPEAGTQRMRDVINKNVSEEEIMGTCRTAFEGGYTAVKLYFMMGLPTETMEDIEGIASLAQRIVDLYYSLPNKPRGKGISVNVSCACFVPKPFTPFEFEPQDTKELLRQKQRHLLDCVKSRKISVHYHDSDTSFLEAVLARGDRRLCAVIEGAWRRGCSFDSWDEHFRFDTWMQVMEELKLDPAFYANRLRSYEEISPWDHLDYGLSKAFLIQENEKAHEDQVTPNCKQNCAGCGANRLLGRACF